MKQGIWLAAVLGCAMMTFTPRITHAAACDTFYGDSGDNIILVGVNAGSYTYQNKIFYYSLGKMAICWQDQAQLWHYVENPTSCNIHSPSTDYVYMSSGPGNDKVAANSVGHLCVAGQTSYLLPFDEPGFSFYMNAELGSGSDYGYGTSNGDKLYSNVIDYWSSGSWTITYPADAANDFLCGYDGDDRLYGDLDHGNSGYWPINASGHEERLNGGLGTDYCNGEDGESIFDWAMEAEPGVNPRTYPVRAGGCNTIVNAASTIGWADKGLQMKSDVCGVSPPNLWWGW